MGNPPHHQQHDQESAPNRNDFEKNLFRLNNGINKLRAQMKNYWTDGKRSELAQQRDAIATLQRTFNRDSVEEKRLSAGLTEKQARHVIKQKEIHDMEDADMTYKNMVQAQQKLAMAEDRYKRQIFASVREEKLQVAEIDRIKRNITKLAKYLPLVEEKKALEQEIKEGRQEIRSMRAQMRHYKDQIHEAKKRIRDLQAPYFNIKKQLYEWTEDRRRIINDYESNRKNYVLWLQQNGARGVSTFPAGMLQDASHMDDFEPFGEQKKTCAKLLRYLRNLKRDCEPDSQSQSRRDSQTTTRTSRSSSAASQDSDSADEFPEAFRLLKVDGGRSNDQSSGAGHSTSSSSAAAKKKSYVRKFVKKTLPITHSIDYIKLFAQIDVAIPRIYAEIDEAIENVEKVHQFYVDQTNLERLEADARADSPLSSLISLNGSEFMDSPSLLSPRSNSSCSSLVIEEANSHPEITPLTEPNFSVHFPSLANVDATRN